MSADQPQNVGLLVILHGSGKTNFSAGKQFDEKSSKTLSLLNLYKQKYPKLSLRWVQIELHNRQICNVDDEVCNRTTYQNYLSNLRINYILL